MDKANKLRFYIDHAIMVRDYAALAVFEDRLTALEAPVCGASSDHCQDSVLSEAPVWLPAEFSTC
ncbi:MAG: hypothetical protein GY794_21945 [bacterium]|nr:hypothetical protein [bacterium]